MGNNVRRVTKMKHKKFKSDKEKFEVKFVDGKLTRSDEGNEDDFYKLYIKKHYILEDKIFKEKSTKIHVYIEKPSKATAATSKMEKIEYCDEINNTTFYFSTTKDDRTVKREDFNGKSKKFRLVNEKELKLLKNRCAFNLQINNLISKVSNGVLIEGYNFRYSVDDVNNLCQYIFDKCEENFFDRESEIFLDQKSIRLYELLIQNTCDNKISNEFIGFLVDVISLSQNENTIFTFEIVKEMFIEKFQANKNRVLNATFKNEYNNKCNIKVVNDFENEYKLNEILANYDFEGLESEISELKKNKYFRDEFVTELRKIIKKNYIHSTKNIDWESENNDVRYIYKICYNYIKSRTNKILKQYPKNEVLSGPFIKNHCDLYKSEKLKLKVDQAVRNKFLYKKQHGFKDEWSIEKKQEYKTNISLYKKLLNVVDDIVYNICSLNKEEDMFIHDISYLKNEFNPSKELRMLNESALVYIDDNFDYPLYVLRNRLYHMQQSVKNNGTLNFHAAMDRNIHDDELDKSITKQLLEFDVTRLYNSIIDNIKESLESNSCTKYYSFDELESVLSLLDLGSDKAAILPRFNKVYKHLSYSEDDDFIKFEKITKCNDEDQASFICAHSYLLQLIYEYYFSNEIDIDNLNELKSTMMSSCTTDDEKRKCENKFVRKITSEFNKVLKRLEVQKMLTERKKVDENITNINCINVPCKTKIELGNLGIYGQLLIYSIPFIRIKILSELKGTLQKYKIFVESITDENLILLKKEEIDTLVFVINAEISNKKKLNKKILEEGEELVEVVNSAYSIFDEFSLFKSKKIEYKYNSVVNDEFSEQTQEIVSNISKTEYVENEKIIAHKFLLDYKRYGHLSKFVDLNKKIINQVFSNEELEQMLIKFGNYKSKENMYETKTKIEKLMDESKSLHHELKTSYYELLTMKVKDYKDQKQMFEDELKKYSKINNEILEYNFIKNLFHLTFFNKVYNMYSTFNSRILGWQTDFYVVTNNNYTIKNELKPILNENYNYNFLQDIFKNARHYNFKKTEDTYRSISETFLGQESMYNAHILTNFKNDVREVLANILEKNNIILENSGKLKSRSHVIFNSTNLKEKLGDGKYCNIKLVSDNEIKFMKKFIGNAK